MKVNAENDPLEIRSYQESDEKAVVQLWRDCDLVVPWNDPVQDIHRKLRVQREMFLVALLGSRLIATVMAGYEGHRGKINYLAVSPDYRKIGYGRRLMEEAETRLRAQGCPKISLRIRSSNAGAMEFYKRIGFSTDDVVSMGKCLEED